MEFKERMYLCMWCWQPRQVKWNSLTCECGGTGRHYFLTHQGYAAHNAKDPRKRAEKAENEVACLKEQICKLTNHKSMCCQDTPCQCQKQCDPCLPPDPKHFVDDLVLISGWKYLGGGDYSWDWLEKKQVEQIKIVEAKYIDGEWRYFDKRDSSCVVTDCHILKNYSYQEPEQKKLGRPKKQK